MSLVLNTVEMTVQHAQGEKDHDSDEKDGTGDRDNNEKMLCTLRMTASQMSCAAQGEEDHDSDERDGRYR